MKVHKEYLLKMKEKYVLFWGGPLMPYEEIENISESFLTRLNCYRCMC